MNPKSPSIPFQVRRAACGTVAESWSEPAPASRGCIGRPCPLHHHNQRPRPHRHGKGRIISHGPVAALTRGPWTSSGVR